MPSLQQYRALWESVSDVFFCQTVQKEHPELHDLLAKTLDIMDSWCQDEPTDNNSDSDTESDSEIHH